MSIALFDCPVNDETNPCDATIVGQYSDLLLHIRKEHPLFVECRLDRDGSTVYEKVKEAQRDRLKQRINEEMVVSGEQGDRR